MKYIFYVAFFLISADFSFKNVITNLIFFLSFRHFSLVKKKLYIQQLNARWEAIAVNLALKISDLFYKNLAFHGIKSVEKCFQMEIGRFTILLNFNLDLLCIFLSIFHGCKGDLGPFHSNDF